MGVKKQIGENIRFYRTLRKLSQAEVAKKAGISTAFVGITERGMNTPSINTIIKIADAMDIPLSDIFYLEPIISNRDKYLRRIMMALRSLDLDDIILVRDIVKKTLTL